MPENKCATCVECFKKHQNPRLQKTTCIDYMESYEKMQELKKLQEQKKIPTYVFEGSTR